MLALLQPAHAQGTPVQSIRPSQLLLHRSGQITTRRALPVPAQEAELYASPEELASGSISPASDIFSLGMLFFELLHPIQDAHVRSRVLGEVRQRVLPVCLGQHRPHETAFLLALLHPEASKRPTVGQIIGSNLLNMLRSSLQQHPAVHSNLHAHQQHRVAVEGLKHQQKPVQTQQPAEAGRVQHRKQPVGQQSAPLAGVDSETLLEFLSIMHQTTAGAVDSTQRQLSFLDQDIQEVNTALLTLQCQQGNTDGELQQQSSAPALLRSSPSPQEPLRLQHPLSRKRQRSWELDSATSGSGALAEDQQADVKKERLFRSCQNVDRAFGELERKFMRQREAPHKQTDASLSEISDSTQVSVPGISGLSDHLADFSVDLIDFSRYNQLKVCMLH